MISKYFKKLDDKKVQCTLCFRFCVIPDGKTGFCKVRKNQAGKLVSMVYGKPISINIDPIEKKPIYHYLPNTMSLSLGTPGCNFDCAFCQNHDISNCANINLDNLSYFSPQKIVSLALANFTPSISYTYTEPTVFAEYALDIMKKAREAGLKNIWVSNGYFSRQLLGDILPYFDAINIDLKGTQAFYDKLIPGISVTHVHDNIRLLYESKIHIELTVLLIDGYNTSKTELEELTDFVCSVSKDIPLHFSRAFPHYRLKDISPTKLESLKLAEKIAKAKGIRQVHLGNI